MDADCISVAGAASSILDKAALWGAYADMPTKMWRRIPMKVETLPFAVEQLTWSFLDMAN